MIVSNIKSFCSKLNKSLKTLVTPQYSNVYLATTTSKWRRRFLLIPLMAQLVITTFVILISWSLQQLQRLVSYLYGGLKKLSTYISTRFLRLIKLITSLQAIQTRCISLLTFWLTRCLNREEQMRKLSISWTVLQKRSWNLLLAKVIKLLLRV